MLNFFKHSFLAQHLVIVMMALILWMPAFITKSAFIPGENITPLYNVIISIFDFSPFILNTLAFAVYLVCIFLFNSVLSANRLVTKNNTVGSLTFGLMMCFAPQLHSCYPFIFACPFILMAMHTLFLIYQTDNPENYMMNIGYFIAIASLFYYPSVFLIASYSYFFRNMKFFYDLNGSNEILFIIFCVLFLITFLRTISNKASDKGSNIRKRVGVAIALTFFSLFMFFIHTPLLNNSLIFMMFAFFYAITLSDIKKTRLANLVTIIVTLLILVNQYLPLFGITI